MSQRKLTSKPSYTPQLALEGRTVVISDIPLSDTPEYEMLLYELRRAIKRYSEFLADSC